MQKIRILVANQPEPIGGVTCWRMYWPLDYLERTWGDALEIRYAREQIFPADLYWSDIVLCYRPSEPAHIGVIEEAKRLGKKILLDYDDDLTAIPVGHPEFFRLGTKAEFVKKAISLADAIWVSTEALKAVIQKNTTDAEVIVIPNAILPETIATDPAKWAPVRNGIWAGSPAHREDADAFKMDYKLIRKNVTSFIWINYMPTWASNDQEYGSAMLHPWIHTEMYFEWMRQNKVAVIWKPLITSQFNACKSNIAYITATAVGAVCVTNQAGMPQWEFALRNMPRSEDDHRAAWKTAAADVRAHYDLRQWNEVRLREILNLINK